MKPGVGGSCCLPVISTPWTSGTDDRIQRMGHRVGRPENGIGISMCITQRKQWASVLANGLGIIRFEVYRPA